MSCRLTLTRNSDNAVLNKDNAINIGKNQLNAFEWYIPHFTTSISNQAQLSKQTLSKTPTELQYVEISVCMKKVTTQNLWNFELGTHDGINILIWNIVGFQQRDRQDSQSFNNDTFYRAPLTSPQCFIGT